MPDGMMMINPYALLSWTLAGVLAISLYPVLRCRRYVSRTTLTGAWWWALVAVVAWMLLAAVRPSLATTRWLSHVHYLASVLALCPFVAILGARLPGARVWNAVVFSLLVVLSMPLLQATIGPLAHRAVSLDEMWSLFVYCVLAVGLLNYLPTRHAPAVILYAVAQLSHLVPLSVWSAAQEGGWQVRGNVASVALAAAIWIARQRALEPTRKRLSEDRLWIAFRDAYGLVWGRRQQDRFNAVAAREGWPLRLAWTGFRWKGGAAEKSIEALERQKSLETLRYQLRRFVDAEWMDAQREL